MTFDLSTLTPAQRSIVEGAIARCDFTFEVCLPALRERWGRPAIVVTWEPLEPYLGALASSSSWCPAPHLVEVRSRVAGLAWSDGRIMLAPWLEPDTALAQEVFLAEGAHQVDFHFITADQRRALFALFHGGDPADHGTHGWFEERGGTSYNEWTGEAWMPAFILAYSDLAPNWMQFSHRVAAEARPTIRAILGVPAQSPRHAPYFGTRSGAIFHDAHSGVARQVGWWTREAAAATGRRPCRICKP